MKRNEYYKLRKQKAGELLALYNMLKQSRYEDSYTNMETFLKRIKDTNAYFKIIEIINKFIKEDVFTRIYICSNGINNVLMFNIIYDYNNYNEVNSIINDIKSSGIISPLNKMISTSDDIDRTYSSFNNGPYIKLWLNITKKYDYINDQYPMACAFRFAIDKDIKYDYKNN